MRLIFLASLLIISKALSAQKFYLFIGTYTNKDSKGIYVYQFDAGNGQLKFVSNTDSVSNPSYLAVSSNGKFVYAVNENGGKIPAEVSAFSFDRKSGQLKFINKQQTGGDHPCYITVAKNNKWLFAGNYSGGSFSVFPVGSNGAIMPLEQLIKHNGSSIVKGRQEKPHVHATVLSPDQKQLFVTDLGTDRIEAYSFHSNVPKPIDTINKLTIPVMPGSGPRHFVFHPNKKFAYLLEELSGTVSAYSYRGDSLMSSQRVSSHPEDYKGAMGSADIHVSPDGRFLYASNRGEANNIAIFSVAASGKLSLKGFQSSLGKKPRNFMIDPTGNYLLVANQETNSIVVFKRDKLTGLLSETDNRVKVPNPVCLKMSK